MKKVILLFLILQCSLQTAESQWIQQYPATVGVALRDIKFINQKTGWACGDGIILKTTNAGTNWFAQNPSTNRILCGLSVVDSLNVFCAGFFETVLKTTNGGDNWIVLRNGPWGQGHSYEGTFFLNKDTGWVCGSLGTILKTTNGGESFDSSFIFWGYTKDMYFLNADTGLLCGEFGGMFKTTNGGLSWGRKTIPYWNGIGDFRKLSVINDRYVFVTEDGKRVFRSTNFGDTWDSIGYVAGADQPYVCRFSSLTTGWVGGTFGELYKSTDFGGTWRRENTGNDQRFIGAMWFLNDSAGWVVGGNTKLLYTTTGGLTFTATNSNEIPLDIRLYQNYPNPFNPITNIKLIIAKSGIVKILIFNSLGQTLETLFDERLQEGTYSLRFDGTNYPSGIYFYKLIVEDYFETKSMMLLK